MNYANSYFWTGKSFAAQYFTAVPFGLNFQGFNGWYYDGGGAQLWREVYDRFNLVPILARQHRRADDRLVPQGDQDRRRPQGRQDAHPGSRRPRLQGARRRLASDRARRDLPEPRARRDRCRRIRRSVPRPPARPAQGREVLLHDRLARDGDRERGHHQQGEVEQPAGRPQGDRRERLRRLQRHQRSLVPEEQRRGDGRPGEEPGHHRAAVARRRGEGAARRDRQDPRPRRWRAIR